MDESTAYALMFHVTYDVYLVRGGNHNADARQLCVAHIESFECEKRVSRKVVI